MLKDDVVSIGDSYNNAEPSETDPIDEPRLSMDLSVDAKRIQSYVDTIEAVAAAAAKSVVNEQRKTTGVIQPPIVSIAGSETMVTAAGSAAKPDLLSLVVDSTAPATVPAVEMDIVPAVPTDVGLTVEGVSTNYTIDDLLAEFDNNYKKFFKPLPPPLTPLQTPARPALDEEEEDAVLRLHPSPTPALEEPVLPPTSTAKTRFPIRPPTQTNDAKKRESPKKKIPSSLSNSRSESRKENVKRASDEDNSKARKRSKESSSASTSYDKLQADDTRFKIPLKPTQDKSTKDPERPTSSLYSRDNPSVRDRGWNRYDDRRLFQATDRRPSEWNFSSRLFDRQPTYPRRVCHLSEEEFRWLSEMPSTWRR